MKQSTHLYLIGILLFGLLSTADAREAQFPDSISAQDYDMQKRGEYRYVYKYFFKLYDAALFSPPESITEDVLTGQHPFHLEFNYLRKIDKAIILESSAKMLSKNLSSNELSSITDRVARINDAYRTVQKGDSSSLTFIPGQGTTLKINGKEVTTIEGDDFARLYFQIWLGEQPISEELKLYLLGGADS